MAVRICLCLCVLSGCVCLCEVDCALECVRASVWLAVCISLCELSVCVCVCVRLWVCSSVCVL